jgi:hypothetical protein
VHVPDENVPDPLHETVPVGLYPVTLALHVVGEPTVTDPGEQETVTLEGAVPTFNTEEPKLPKLFASPGYEAVMLAEPTTDGV